MGGALWFVGVASNRTRRYDGFVDSETGRFMTGTVQESSAAKRLLEASRCRAPTGPSKRNVARLAPGGIRGSATGVWGPETGSLGIVRWEGLNMGTEEAPATLVGEATMPSKVTATRLIGQIRYSLRPIVIRPLKSIARTGGVK